MRAGQLQRALAGPGVATPRDVLTLQRVAGNRAVSRLLASRRGNHAQDTFFRDGNYAPESRDGQELIPHELTHVVQQDSSVIQGQIDKSVDRETTQQSDVIQRIWLHIPETTYYFWHPAGTTPTVPAPEQWSGHTQILAGQVGNYYIEDGRGGRRSRSAGTPAWTFDVWRDYVAQYKAKKGFGGIPKNTWTEKTVQGTKYKFKNESDGTLDFESPWTGYPKVSKMYDINIADPSNSNKLKHTNQQTSLKTSRYNHFKVANIEAYGSNNTYGGSSPPGWTWHHHKDSGRMQLIDRDVHAAFKHAGGYSIWGK